MKKNSSRVRRQNGNIEKYIKSLARKFRESMAAGDYQQAQEHCMKVLQLMPGNVTVLCDYALTLMRCGEYQKAYDTYMTLYQMPSDTLRSPTWLDGLTEVCGWLGRHDDVRKYGCESLENAHRQYQGGEDVKLAEPPVFDPTDPSQNIIAFSLFGSNPRYCETLIMNADACKELYPDWTIRVYLDDTVPAHVIRRLECRNAQIVDMTNEKIIPPTLWRFLVADDPHVSRFIIRDADSLVSEKEQAAVEEWQHSKYWFHHMRDYFTHSDLVLAGMWGGCSGAVTDITGKMRTFCSQYTGAPRYTDQNFLKAVLWPTLRQSLMAHDEIFGFHGALPWPTHAPVRWEFELFHVGSNVSSVVITGPALPSARIQSVQFCFRDEKNDVIYPAPIKDSRWELPLPFFLEPLYAKGELEFKLIHED